MSEPIMPCTRCGQRGAEPPDGITIFAYRNLFGPSINRRLCARCFAIRGWQTGRYLVAVIGTIIALATALDGQWLAPVAATASTAGWWWFTGAQLRALARRAAPPGEPSG